jgi:putative nucleotidyltransferase with HDIG domain
VEQDVAISAKILQLVNSALFGLAKRVLTVQTAVSYLGIDLIKNLVLTVEVFRAFQGDRQIGGFSMEEVHVHAYLTAQIAARLPSSGHLKDAAYVAALLHDVGKLILMTRLPEQFARALAGAHQRECPVQTVEEELIGVTHAEIGAYLLGLWGLPYPVVEAVAHHHTPTRVPSQALDPLATVYVANILAHEVGPPSPQHGALAQAPIDLSYLESLGVAEQVPAWRSMAAAAAGSVAEA